MKQAEVAVFNVPFRSDALAILILSCMLYIYTFSCSQMLSCLKEQATQCMHHIRKPRLFIVVSSTKRYNWYNTSGEF